MTLGRQLRTVRVPPGNKGTNHWGKCLISDKGPLKGCCVSSPALISAVRVGRGCCVSSSPSYFRRQAGICLNFALVADGEVGLRLVAMAEEYLEKAEACEREADAPPYIAVIQDAARHQARVETKKARPGGRRDSCRRARAGLVTIRPHA
jgi:hypothetical protein